MASRRNRQPKAQPPRPVKRASRVHKRSLTSTITRPSSAKLLHSTPTSVAGPKAPVKEATSAITTNESSGQTVDPQPVLNSIERIERPARFWQGATVGFRVAQSIDLLESSQTFNSYERIACIHDITETLSSARTSLETFGELLVSNDSVDRLAHLLHTFKTDSLVPVKLAVLNMGRRAFRLDSLTDDVDRWHKLSLDVLRMSKPYAVEKGFEHIWADASKKMTTIWLAELQRLTVIGSGLLTAPIGVPTQRSIDMDRPSEELLSSSLSIVTSAQAANAAVDDITSFYKRFSSDQNVVAGSSFFSDLDHLYDTLARLLASGLGATPSLMESQISTDNRNDLENWCQRFGGLWTSAVKDALEKQFQDLSARVDQATEPDLEQDLSTLGTRLEAAVKSAPPSIDSMVWAKYYPSFADDLDQTSSRVRLAHLYATYQDMTYRKDERSLLWLLVWRSLKTMYCLTRASNKYSFHKDLNEPLADRYSVEKAFFADANILLDMERAVALPETQNVKLIEDLVARYCQHVSECRERADNHCAQFSRLGDTALSAKQLSTIEDFHKEPIWTSEQSVLLHRMAFRMNSLLGGSGKTLRRRAVNSDQTIQVWMALDGVARDDYIPNAPALLQDSRVHDDFTDGPRTSEPETNVASVQPQRIDGITQTVVPSAFSYVRYPFADTRATQVMESRQIAREMATSGYMTEGPRESDIVNLPRRHVSLDPPLPSGWGVTDLVRRLFQLRRIPPRPRLAMTPGRLPPRSLTDPIVDPNARVRKPPSPSRTSRMNGHPRTSGNSDDPNNHSDPFTRPDHATPSSPDTHNHVPTNISTARQTPGNSMVRTNLEPNLGRTTITNQHDVVVQAATRQASQPVFEIWTDNAQGPEDPNSDSARSVSSAGQIPRRRRGLFERPGHFSNSGSDPSSDEHGSNQENNSPRIPSTQRLLCHPCPVTAQAGAHNQWHHFCDPVACQGYQTAVVRTAHPGSRSGSGSHTSSRSSGSSANSSNQENRSPGGTSSGPSRDRPGARLNDGILSPRAPLEEVHINPQGFAAAQALLALSQVGNNTDITQQPANANTQPTFAAGSAFAIHQDITANANTHDTGTQAVNDGGPGIAVAVGPTRGTQTDAHHGDSRAGYADASIQTDLQGSTHASPVSSPTASRPTVPSAGPSRALYELMTSAEMRAELIHRYVPTTGLTRRDQMVQQLMTEDAQGNMGRGAHGRRSDMVANGGQDPGPMPRAGPSAQQQPAVAGPSNTNPAPPSGPRRSSRIRSASIRPEDS